VNVAIPAEFEPFVESVISAGAYRDPAEVVGEALRLLARRDELRREIRAGVEQLDRGEYTEYDENSLERLLEDIRAAEREQYPKETGCS
jgi:putative addiction module CopG family antidote